MKSYLKEGSYQRESTKHLKPYVDPVRRNILEMFKQGPKSAGEIAQAFELTPATVSYHLSQLVAGILLEEKKTLFIIA